MLWSPGTILQLSWLKKCGWSVLLKHTTYWCQGSNPHPLYPEADILTTWPIWKENWEANLYKVDIYFKVCIDKKEMWENLTFNSCIESEALRKLFQKNWTACDNRTDSEDGRDIWWCCCCCQLASSIAKMWCFTVLVGAVHNYSTVSVVSFDIAGTLKQKVGVALPASAAPPPTGDLTSR